MGKIGIVTNVHDEPGHPYDREQPACSYVARDQLLLALVTERGLPGAAHGILSSNGASLEEMEKTIKCQ